MNKKSETYFIFTLISGQLIVTILNGISAIIQSRFIPPSVLGMYNSFTVIGGYLLFLQLGVMVSFRRDYSFYLGKNNANEANETAANVLGWILLITFISIIIYLILIFISVYQKNINAVIGWISQLLIIVSQFYTLYLGASYKSNSEFKKWSLINVVGSFFSFLLLPVVIFGSYLGVCIRMSLPLIVISILMHVNRPVKVKPKIDIKKIVSMMRFGLPVDLAGNLSTVGIVSTMSWVLLQRYDVTILGLVMISKLFEGLFTQLSEIILSVYTPRVTFMLGQTSNKKKCFHKLLIPMFISLIGLMLVLIVASFIIPSAVNLVIPKYSEAVPFIKVMIWASVVPILTMPRLLLIAEKKTSSLVISSLVSFIFFIVMVFMPISINTTPIWISFIYVLSRIVLGVVSALLTLKSVYL